MSADDLAGMGAAEAAASIRDGRMGVACGSSTGSLGIESIAPAYTSGTLKRLREQGHRRTHLFFIVGADAFAEIATWHDYPTVLDGAHFVVVSRPGHPAADLVETLPDLRTRMRPIPRGADRPRVDANAAPAVFLIDEVTPDISSTAIRARIARGDPLDGLVPSNVAAYIKQHRLYSSQRGEQLA